MIDENCLICGSSEYNCWAEKDGMRAVQCQKCSFVWVNPKPSDQDISDFYLGYADLRKNIDSDITNKRKEQYLLDRDFISQFFNDREQINTLDFGCHDGMFLDTFGDGFLKHGIELSGEAVMWAKNNMSFGQDVHNCDIVNAPYKNKTFDLIIMRGVIEHLTSPNECMEKVADLLSDDGMLYIAATPNVNSYSADAFRENWNQFVPPAHLLYFSDYTLERYLKSFGFRLMAKRFPYAETPYADLKKDFAEIKSAHQLAKAGSLSDTIDVPFHNNMISAVFYKAGM